MAEYIKLYGTVNEYLQTEDNVKYVSSIIPGVAYVEEDGGTRYNRKKGPVMRVVWNESTDAHTRMSDEYPEYYEVKVNGQVIEPERDSDFIYWSYTAETATELVMELEFADGVTALNSEFYGANGMYIPEGITEIGFGVVGTGTGSGLFGNLTLPTTLLYVGDDCFPNSFSQGDEIVIPSLVSAGTDFMASCRMSSIELPANLEYLGSWALRSCSNLSEITCHATVAPQLGSEYCLNYNGPDRSGTLYYPAGSDYSSWLTNLNYGGGNWVGVAI